MKYLKTGHYWVLGTLENMKTGTTAKVYEICYWTGRELTLLSPYLQDKGSQCYTWKEVERVEAINEPAW